MSNTKKTIGIIFILIFLCAAGVVTLAAGGIAYYTLVPQTSTISNTDEPRDTVEESLALLEPEATSDSSATDESNSLEEGESTALTTDNNDPARAAAQQEEEADPGTPLPEELSPEDLALFFEVWRNIETEFDGEMPSVEELNYAIINGALRTLDDDYTRFLTPEMAEREREAMEGSFEGIGAFVRENEAGFIEIARPMSGQPAEQAGIRAGDLIVAVDGEDVTGQTLDEVISKVRGPRGTQVILTIAREGEAAPLEFTITRALIDIPALETRMLDNNIAYLHLTTFAEFGIDREVEQAVRDLLAQNPSGFILDLRDNPGGFLDSSVNIADLFLPEGVVLYERSESGVYDRTFESFDGDIAEEIPLVVLVNAGSASASELVAGALRDNDRAVLIGEQTFGKGSVQQLRDLSGGAELRVTIARWYTPEDANINGEGLTPDIVVEFDPEATLGDVATDAPLQRAIQFLLTGE
jgi:carboxyl-terminal processing protease